MKSTLLIALLCVSTLAIAQQQRPQPPQQQGGSGERGERGGGGGERGERGGGPPPEALTACKGKKEGDTVQFKNPHGDTMSATCRMVAVPSRPQGGERQGDRQGPPPQR